MDTNSVVYLMAHAVFQAEAMLCKISSEQVKHHSIITAVWQLFVSELHFSITLLEGLVIDILELFELQLTDCGVNNCQRKFKSNQNCNSEGSIDCQRTVTAKWQLLSSLIVLPTENVLLKMREARFAKMANCPAFRFASSTGNS